MNQAGEKKDRFGRGRVNNAYLGSTVTCSVEHSCKSSVRSAMFIVTTPRDAAGSIPRGPGCARVVSSANIGASFRQTGNPCKREARTCRNACHSAPVVRFANRCRSPGTNMPSTAYRKAKALLFFRPSTGSMPPAAPHHAPERLSGHSRATNSNFFKL